MVPRESTTGQAQVTPQLPLPDNEPDGFRVLHAQRLNPLTEFIVDLGVTTLAAQRRHVRALTRAAQERLATLADERSSSTCVIAGNGPSLNDVDWDQLDGTDTFASNYAADHPELKRRIRVLSVVNPWVISQRPTAFFDQSFAVALPYYLAYWLPTGKADIAVNAHGGFHPALDLSQPFSTRSTVSYFNLQLAYLLGYRKVLLVGFDHRYEQPHLAPEGAPIRAGASDPNHFTEGYFADKVWQAADLSRMEVAYAPADIHYQRTGAKVLNCTPGSALDIFPKTSVAAALAEPLTPPKETQPAGISRSIAVLAQRLNSPRSKPVTIVALLIALAVGTANGSTLGFAVGIISFIAAAAGVFLLNGSVNARHQQIQDDSAEIIASLHRASENSQPIGNGSVNPP